MEYTVPFQYNMEQNNLFLLGKDDLLRSDGRAFGLVPSSSSREVRRVTVLCGGEEGTVERAVRDSDLEWTLLRPAEFMAGHDLDWGEYIRAGGVVREPFADRTSALVHEADIGAVAATVLAEGGYGGETLVITGPEALTLSEKVSIVGEVVGRDVRLIELTEEQAREKWRSEGYTVHPTVEQVTCRPARTFARWVSENADAFRS